MATPGDKDTTLRFIEFVAQFDASTAPDRVHKECVRATTNAVGCIIGGARHEMVETASRCLAEFEGAGVATLLGRKRKTDVLTAALLNALSGAAYSFDDTYTEFMLHPSVPVVAALLAACERSRVSGADFLSAFAVGLETACRLSKVLTVAPAAAEIAWSQTGVCCGVAAAVAVGKLLKLDRRRLGSALGIAASEASGSRVTHGSMAASLIYGHAAQTGLRAALLAADGFTSSEGALEDRFGFAALFSHKANLSALLEGLGESYELQLNTYKPFPCGLVIHPVIDGILQLRRQIGFASDEIAGVELRVSPNAMVFASNPEPKNELQAKVSMHHWAAAAAMTGKAGLAEGCSKVIDDPEIRRLRGLINAIEDRGCAVDAAGVAVTLRNGERHDLTIDHCVGSLKRPMTDDDLVEKFIGQAAPTIGRECAAACLRACRGVSELSDAAEIANSAR